MSEINKIATMSGTGVDIPQEVSEKILCNHGPIQNAQMDAPIPQTSPVLGVS